MPSVEITHAAPGNASGLRVRPVSDAIGAEILDVDLSAVDDALFDQIHAAWMDHCVLLFRDQAHMTDDALVAFSKRVGTLDQAPPNENGKRFVEGYPEILVISNVVENGVALGRSVPGNRSGTRT